MSNSTAAADYLGETLPLIGGQLLSEGDTSMQNKKGLVVRGLLILALVGFNLATRVSAIDCYSCLLINGLSDCVENYSGPEGGKWQSCIHPHPVKCTVIKGGCSGGFGIDDDNEHDVDAEQPM